MTIEITNYETLVEAARQDPDPQRLLFLFLESYLMEDHSDEEAKNFNAGKGGGLKPVFHVNFTPDELSTFEALATESQGMETDWHVVLVGCLSGEDGNPPTDKSIEEWTQFMEQAVLNGSPLSQFLAFDRSGDPLHFS